MKYKVVSDRTPFQQGTTFVLDKDVSGIVFDTNNATYPAIGRDMLRQYPEDFEPVEQVQEGQYRQYEVGGPVRIMSVYGDRVVVKLLHNDEEREYPIGDIINGTRKLYTDEIEEALTKEFERRYADHVPCKVDYFDAKDQPLKGVETCTYHEKTDTITVHSARGFHECKLYKQATWAEIIDQTPHIEINGYEAEFHEDYVQFGCAKIAASFIGALAEYYEAYGFGDPGKGNRVVTGIKIGEAVFTIDQIKQIASYYE